MDVRQHADLRCAWLKFCALACAAILCATVICSVGGCKTNGNAELLERELRMQEDRIYQLEDELESMCDALESARRENSLLKREGTGSSGPTTSRGGRSSSSTSPPQTFSPPSVTTPDGPTTSPPSIQVPSIDVPGDEAPTLPAPSLPAPSNPDEPPPLFIPNVVPPTESRIPAGSNTPAGGEATKITQLSLNRQLTGGWNSDGKFGDEGLFVAFEPQDANKKPVKAIGDVSIVALDPTQSGAAGRVGRWEFTADEAATHQMKGPLSSGGYQFELPWSSEPPKTRDLKIFIRVTTPDGRKVESDAAVKIIPYDREGKRWTPKATASTESPPANLPKAFLPQATELNDNVTQASAPQEVAETPTPIQEPVRTLEPIPVQQKPRQQQKTVRRPRWSPNRR